MLFAENQNWSKFLELAEKKTIWLELDTEFFGPFDIDEFIIVKIKNHGLVLELKEGEISFSVKDIFHGILFLEQDAKNISYRMELGLISKNYIDQKLALPIVGVGIIRQGTETRNDSISTFRLYADDMDE